MVTNENKVYTLEIIKDVRLMLDKLENGLNELENKRNSNLERELLEMLRWDYQRASFDLYDKARAIIA